MSFKSDFGTEFVRNLVGIFLMAVGILVILLGAHWHMDVLVTLGTATLIPAALLVPVLVWRLLREETFLAANLPGYDAYRGRVRYRLAPIIW